MISIILIIYILLNQQTTNRSFNSKNTTLANQPQTKKDSFPNISHLSKKEPNEKRPK